jgi:hypothetical protein
MDRFQPLVAESFAEEELPPLPHVQPLNDADRDLFLSVLDNPPEPNAALRKLMSSDAEPTS